MLEDLQNRFGHLDGVHFTEPAPGFPEIQIQQRGTSARLSLYGGQLMGCRFDDGVERLWQNSALKYEQGKALRAGVPVCWPWFGPAAQAPGHTEIAPHAGAHGFVRNRLWQLEDVQVHDDISIVELRTWDDQHSAKYWPWSFELQLQLTVQRQRLRLRLSTLNRDVRPFMFNGALHSYFSCDDVGDVLISGLEHCLLFDQLTGLTNAAADEWQPLDSETDRIYRSGSQNLMLSEPGARSPLLVYGGGHTDTVIWNPGAEKAASLGDIAGNEWRHFLCAETAIAGGNAITLAPGSIHRMSLILRPLSL